MDLHYAGKVADWETVAPEQRNRWQRWAVRTDGLVTPGNAVSIAGLLLTVLGIVVIAQNHLAAGVSIVGVGRFADVLDGMVAEATKTKSSIGEAVDAGADKIAAAGMLAVLLAKGILPVVPGIIIAMQNVANVAISFWERARGVNMHPNRSGKLAAVWEWLAILFYTITYITHHNHAAQAAAGVAFAGFVAFGYISTIKYIRHVLRHVATTRHHD